MGVWANGRFDAESFSLRSADDRAATPFPHAVFTEILNPDIPRAVAAEFERRDQIGTQFSQQHEQGKAIETDWLRLGPATRQVLGVLNGGEFVDALERVTGIDDLISDPRLWGGGQHKTESGGRLEVHVDFNKHPVYGFDGRLNVLVFLNEPWPDEWGGALELWDRAMTAPVSTIATRLGAVVVFTTDNTSYDGHPHPVQCPPDVTRKSLALYYYTVDQPAGQDSTLWQQQPDAAPIATNATRTKLGASTSHLKSAVGPWIPERVRRALRAK
jgi:Rps23 Pro-64 3,4-dihydroxylase Tpa1-like proline 4-hydroxylase